MIRRGRWFEKQVSDFIYGKGENPFQRSLSNIPFGVGIRKDSFDPTFERPNVNSSDLAKLNICKDHHDHYEL